VPKRVNMERNEQSAAAEQGNCCYNNTGEEMAAPAWIRCKI